MAEKTVIANTDVQSRENNLSQWIERKYAFIANTYI